MIHINRVASFAAITPQLLYVYLLSYFHHHNKNTFTHFNFIIRDDNFTVFSACTLAPFTFDPLVALSCHPRSPIFQFLTTFQFLIPSFLFCCPSFCLMVILLIGVTFVTFASEEVPAVVCLILSVVLFFFLSCILFHNPPSTKIIMPTTTAIQANGSMVVTKPMISICCASISNIME